MKTRQRLFISDVLYKIRKSKKGLAYFFALCILNFAIGCSYYGIKWIPVKNSNFTSEYKLATEKKERYIILHDSNSVKHLTNVSIDEEKKIISANVGPVDSKYQLYPLKEGKKSTIYNKSKVKKALELHLHTNKKIAESQTVNLSFSDIKLMEVHEPDTGKTVLSAFGFTIATGIVILLLLLATKSSCPFVYVQNEGNYVFAGELYPGAILPKLERTDYLPLPSITPDHNNQYLIKVTNELLEIQHTDLVEIVVVDHPDNTEILLDQNGIVQTIAQKKIPEKVNTNNQELAIQPAISKDNNAFLFDTKSESKGVNTLEFSFKKEKADNGKLVLSAKNSLWFDYLFGKFNEKFGTYYNTFQKKQRKASTADLEKWRNDQQIPLSVYVKINEDWRLVEKINPVGPLAYRDIVVPIDLKNISASTIEIKLESGFMFWELDYIAMDQSSNQSLQTSVLKPTEAFDENGRNVTNLLIKADKSYLIQPSTTNEVTVKFTPLIPQKGLKQSVFLKNRGYYEYIRNYTNPPDFSELKTFKNPGRLSEYSEEEYIKFIMKANINEIVFKNE